MKNNNWEIKTIGEMLKLEYGKPLSESERKIDGKFLAYGANGVKARTDKFYYDRPSIIVGRKGSAGEVTLVEGKFWPLDVTYYVTFDTKYYDLKYLYLLLQSLNLPKLATGVKPGINRNEVYSISVTVPPLSEQKRIAKTLDEKFEAIEKLKKATQQQIEDSKELFESHLNSLIEEISKKSDLVRMSDLFDVRDGTHDSPKYQKKGRALVTSKNLKDGKLLLDNVKYISEADYSDICKRSGVSVGDVLFAMIGTIGNPVVIVNEPDYAIKNIALFKVPQTQDSDFLRYFLLSNYVKDKMKKEAKGATQQFVGLGYLRSFPVPRVGYSEQLRIVKKLNDFSEKIKAMELIFNNKLKDLEELKKSYLKEAFAGKL